MLSYNNSANTRSQVTKKLQSYSIKVIESDMYCCAYATQIYLKEASFDNVYLIGTEAIRADLLSQGINVLEEANNQKIDALVICMDIDFNYTKLVNVYYIMQKNVHCNIIVCNRDNSFPVENDLRKPGCGAIVSSILTVSEKNIDFMIGKPHTYMLDLISKERNISPDNILVIGDSYESDIKMANKANAHSILIVTDGVSKIHETIRVSKLGEIQHVFSNFYD